MKISTWTGIAIGALVWWYFMHRPSSQPLTANLVTGAQKPTADAPAGFTVTPELVPVVNTPITEAAYHQQPIAYAPAFGFGENQTSSEVISLQ